MRRRRVALSLVVVAGLFFAGGFMANGLIDQDDGMNAANCQAAIANYKLRKDYLTENAAFLTPEGRGPAVADYNRAYDSMTAACLP